MKNYWIHLIGEVIEKDEEDQGRGERWVGEVLQTLKRGVKLREEDDCKIANLGRGGRGRDIVVRGGCVLYMV